MIDHEKESRIQVMKSANDAIRAIAGHEWNDEFIYHGDYLMSRGNAIMVMNRYGKLVTVVEFIDNEFVILEQFYSMRSEYRHSIEVAIEDMIFDQY